MWPMLITRTLGREDASTILGGVVELTQLGSYGVAFIVFFASIVIPVAKFTAIAVLVLAVRHEIAMSQTRLTHLYEVVEFIGRWSMIDIFVVAILAALVQLGFLASLAPGPAAACFALSVTFTMLSAKAFDTRLIWDRIGETK
jgi:paraquat-inducible protein A